MTAGAAALTGPGGAETMELERWREAFVGAALTEAKATILQAAGSSCGGVGGGGGGRVGGGSGAWEPARKKDLPDHTDKAGVGWRPTREADILAAWRIAAKILGYSKTPCGAE